MKKKMSDRDKMLLFYLAAIVIIAGVYFLVFTKLNEKKAEFVSQNEQLQVEVTRLSNMDANKQTVLDETRDYQLEIGDTLSKFPSEVRTQNVIYDLNQMYESIDDVNIESESYLMNQIFYQPAAGVDENGNPITPTTAAPTQNVSVSAVTADTPVAEVVSAAANYTGYRSDISVVFTAPYHSLKEIIDFINGSDDRMTITSLSVTEVEGENVLSCNMIVSMYAISGTGEIYEQPEVGTYEKKGDVFGSN